ncbi:hypothetical protein IFM89_033409 [Coptis chinensis]|uniref:RNase H type-1 domain-containing protein n=1 Tax=Coptis chinensis TaxID=261450 RepID=A0A835HZC5_9MAGN|nr:hypothetical protein IFM89_033409 [Coptis chinensis]
MITQSANKIDKGKCKMNNPTTNSLLQLQTIPPTNHPPKWKPPTHPSQKLNVDAAYLCDTQCFGIGFILRDSHGSFLAAGTRTDYTTSAEDAECRGTLMATQWALARQISYLEIETDAQAIATYWENLHSNLAWQSELILQDIRLLSSHFVHFSISFCNRLLNGTADILSHKALLLKDSYQWEGDPPLWLVDAIVSHACCLQIVKAVSHFKLLQCGFCVLSAKCVFMANQGVVPKCQGVVLKSLRHSSYMHTALAFARPFSSKTFINTDHIGIDIGVNNTRVAIMKEDCAEVIHTSPSVVAFVQKGKICFGDDAKFQSVIDPENTFFGIKSFLGRKFDDPLLQKEMNRFPFKIDRAPNGDAWVDAYGQQISPAKILALILGDMKRNAESFIGKPISKAIFNFSGKTTINATKAMMSAFPMAGLAYGISIDVTTAAEISYGLYKKEGVSVVLDLGGSSFEVIIRKRCNDKVHDTTKLDTSLGGDDFDRALMEYLVSEFKGAGARGLAKNRSALQWLRLAAEEAKIELSSAFETDIILPCETGHPFIINDASDVDLYITLTRSKLESLVNNLVERTRNLCQSCLSDAGITAKDVDEVLLIGGMARVPKLQEVVAEIFGKSPCKGVNPDEAVALGVATAIQAGYFRQIVWENYPKNVVFADAAYMETFPLDGGH